MDGSLTGEIVTDIRNIIHDKHRRDNMAARNYRIAEKHYSYALLRKQFAGLISHLFPHQRHTHQESPRAAAGS